MGELVTTTLAEEVETIIRKWERERLGPEAAEVRRRMGLDLRLVMQRREREALRGGALPRCPECGARFSVVVPVTLADATITDTCGHPVRVEVRDNEPGVWHVTQVQAARW